MLVCPSCRTANSEEATRCESCGAEMRASTSLAKRRTEPVEFDVTPPPPPPRWRRITALAVGMAALAAASVWAAVRPSPCDGKYSSDQFDYCVAVPQGWTSTTARIGSADVDEFTRHEATAVVMSIPLRAGISVDAYAEVARRQDKRAGLISGPKQSVRLGGVEAMQWEISHPDEPTFQGLEVVTVNDDVGWTVQLNDDAATYPATLESFHSMLASWHFR